MVAGRELDALVAEKVMGWSVNRSERGWETLGVRPKRLIGRRGMCRLPGDAWSPSEDISAAWEVVEKLGAVRIEKFSDGWYAQFGERERDRNFRLTAGIADMAPLAICLAALAAVGATDGGET